MSEAESETTQEETGEQGSAEDEATTDEYNKQDEPDEDGEPEPEPEPETEPVEPSAEATDEDERRILSEKALAKRDASLDKENARHAQRVGQIMEDGAGDLIPCPVCMDGIAGWIYPPEAQQLSDEAISRVRQVIGLPDYGTFEDAPDARTCPECSGRGEVRTGSQVPGYETKTCRLCKKMGWIPVGATANGETIEPLTGEIITGPTVFTGASADPEVDHLRQRGFTVIPPMQVPAS